jgi:hypothetical protein
MTYKPQSTRDQGQRWLRLSLYVLKRRAARPRHDRAIRRLNDDQRQLVHDDSLRHAAAIDLHFGGDGEGYQC